MPAPKVKSHTHATPQVYLRRFAVDGLLIGQSTGQVPRQLGTPVVGVRKRWFTLETAHGRSNQLEDALAALESRVKHVFAKFDAAQLPLSSDDKAVMAEFIGTQMCRGMGYRELRRALFDQRVPALRDRVREIYREHAPARIAEAESHDLSPLISKNETMRALVDTSRVMANALVNMRWQMVRWPRPVLLSSDQPAVCWRAPHQSSPWGVSQAVEMRMPLSPTQAVVASWHDGPDADEVVEGDRLAAMSMNHHTRKHRVDWLYWQPGTEPVRGHPLHDLPLSGPPPQQSLRLARLTQHVEKLIENREQGITVFPTS
jgi:hypothetical protein